LKEKKVCGVNNLCKSTFQARSKRGRELCMMKQDIEQMQWQSRKQKEKKKSQR